MRVWKANNNGIFAFRTIENSPMQKIKLIQKYKQTLVLGKKKTPKGKKKKKQGSKITSKCGESK